MSDLLPSWDPYDEIIALRDKVQVQQHNERVMMDQLNGCIEQIHRLAFAYSNLLELYQMLQKKVDLNESNTKDQFQQLKR